MRSLVLVILSAVAVAGMFMLYWTMQPTARRVAIESNAAVVVVPHQSEDDEHLNNLRGFHPGDVVWFKQYDDKQTLSTAFSAKEFLPQPDGTVHVKSPVAEFFLANRQRIELTGQDGNVVLKDPPDLRRTAMMSPGPMSPPSRGRLNHVRIIFYDEARPPGRQAVLTMVTDNIVFDNETFLIFTEGFRNDAGEAIANDQVPVDVDGEDLEFHGRGLTLRWNDKDGRLELLEIAHGEVMKIKHPGNFTPLGGPAKTRRRSAAPVALLPGQPLPEMLAAKGKDADQEIIRHHPQLATRPSRARTDRAAHGSNVPVVYLATFYDKVLITQPAPSGASDQLEITGDRMDVNFLMKQSTERATTQPAAPTSLPATPLAATQPDTQPAAPTTQATTQPAEQPVFVRWSGILRVTPAKTTPPVPLSPGDSAITLVGAPVTVHRVDPAQQNTEDVRCASVLYQTAGEKVLLARSEQYSQILITDAPGPKAKEQRATRIDSNGTVEYSKVDQKVLLNGPGRAEVPVESTEKDKHPLLQAAWSRQALFNLTTTTPDEQATVHDAHFAGDVDIRHPKLALKSQALDLLFDPRPKPARAGPGERDPQPHQAQPDLRQVVASTDVFCVVEDSQGKKQNIEAQRLVLDTDVAGEKLYPQHLNATGAVHVWGEDDLRAGYLDVVMKPSNKPAPQKPAGDQPPKKEGELDTAQVEVESVLAKENVVARSKDGSVAEGQELRVTTPGGKQHVTITSPTAARVTDAQGNVVVGPAIEADPDEGRAHVGGPGSIHIAGQKAQPVAQPVAQQGGVKPATDPAKKPGPPTDVTWLGAADFDGAANRIDVTGSVMSKSIDKNGAVNTAVGEHMRIDLRPKPAPPATRPAVAATAIQAAAKKPPATGPASPARMDLFGNKEMVALTIEKGATMTSTLSAADGGVLQQLQLSGPVITVREIGPDGTASRSLTVPAAGKMLVRDHRPPEKQASDDANGAGGARGATAFEWHKQLVYVESDHRADMTGQVRVVHQDEDVKQPPVEVNAETVTAIFEPAPQSAPNDPKKPAPKKDQTDQSSQLKYLIAKGPYVQVIRAGSQMIAQQIDYDPRHHILIATGNPRNPVVFDSGGSEQITADRAEWDTITWNPRFKNPIVNYHPAAPSTQPAKHVKEATPELKKPLKK